MASAERRAEVVWEGKLIAAAHGSCFAMALSNVLDEGGTPPERLEITAVCKFEVDNVKVSSVDLDVRGRVPGMDAEGFHKRGRAGGSGLPRIQRPEGQRGHQGERQPGRRLVPRQVSPV